MILYYLNVRVNAYIVISYESVSVYTTTVNASRTNATRNYFNAIIYVGYNKYNRHVKRVIHV
jgi:hypothetical protein